MHSYCLEDQQSISIQAENEQAAEMQLPCLHFWQQRTAMQTKIVLIRLHTGFEALYNCRWFTPAAEVQLCGHATLAAAAAIFKGKLQAPVAACSHACSPLMEQCRKACFLLPFQILQPFRPDIAQNMSWPIATASPLSFQPQLNASWLCVGPQRFPMI